MSKQRYTVVVTEGQDIRWYKEGTTTLHRVGGPAIEYNNSDKCYYQEGKLHRLDGSAVEYNNNSDKYYCQEGKLHRLDGPAEITNGFQRWFINGIAYSEKEYNKKISQMKDVSICNPTVIEIDGIKYKLVKVE